MNEIPIHRIDATRKRFRASYIALGPDECWLWLCAISKNGYGQTHVSKRTVWAHRVAWMLANGPIPAGLHVLHKCDRRCCVNPKHLWLGTRADNMADMVAKGRSNRGVDKHTAKLTPKQVRAIRADPRAQRTIAKDYGVGQAAIGCIKRGKYWRHIA